MPHIGIDWSKSNTSDRAYHKISDDCVKSTFSLSFESMVALLRPDRALALTPPDPPRELFKDQCVLPLFRHMAWVHPCNCRPIEATVILLPIFEFLHNNVIFSNILLEHISEEAKPSHIPPPPFTLLTLSSYLLTHASSTFSPRSMAYANLSLNILLGLVENDQMMRVFCQPSDINIRICRQVSLMRRCQSKTSPVHVNRDYLFCLYFPPNHPPYVHY